MNFDTYTERARSVLSELTTTDSSAADEEVAE